MDPLVTVSTATAEGTVYEPLTSHSPLVIVVRLQFPNVAAPKIEKSVLCFYYRH